MHFFGGLSDTIDRAEWNQNIVSYSQLEMNLNSPTRTQRLVSSHHRLSDSDMRVKWDIMDSSSPWLCFLQTLLRIDFDQNKIGDQGAQYLADALKVNQVSYSSAIVKSFMLSLARYAKIISNVVTIFPTISHSTSRKQDRLTHCTLDLRPN